MKRTNIAALGKRLKKKTDAIIGARLKESLPAIIRLALEHAQIHSVTGNTMNSFAVALWHDGKFMGFYSSYQELHKAPTRVTLVKGETYDQPYYWGGDPNDGYTAPSGTRHYWGQEEAEDWLSFHFPRKNRWAFVIVAATDYAKYLEVMGAANVIGGLQNDLEGRGADVSNILFA